MGEVVYRSEVRIVRRKGIEREASMPAGETVRFGVHGPIAAHYGIRDLEGPPVSATIDYVVAAAAG